MVGVTVRLNESKNTDNCVTDIICEPNPGSPRPESNIPEVVREAFKYHLQYLLLAGIGVVFSLLFLLLFVLSSHLGNKLISLM